MVDRIEQVRYGAGYRPADGNRLPAYFYAMLDDADRSLMYFKAIAACVDDLRRLNKQRPIVVVDVGMGTGFLSACALMAGADFVIGVDVNAAAKVAAESAIRNIFKNDAEKSSRFLPVLLKSPADDAAKLRTSLDKALAAFKGRDALTREIAARPLLFDIVVSEVLGTLVFGEDMDKYLLPYIALTSEHNGRLFAIPERCTQTFGIYDFDVPVHLKLAAETALRDMALERKYVPTDSRGLGVPLYAHPYEKVSDAVAFYDIVYRSKARAKVKHAPGKVKVHTPTTDKMRLVVCEWTCKLWDNIELKNTLDRCVEISKEFKTGDRYALARQEAWGFMICDANGVKEVSAQYTREGMMLNLKTPSHSYTLNDVSDSNACSYVAFAADVALARDIAKIVSAETAVDFDVVIVNDVTCGALCAELANQSIQNVRVIYTPEWLKTHTITTRVVEALGLNVSCETTAQRKRLRDLSSTKMACRQADYIIFPELFYMNDAHKRRVSFYRNLMDEAVTPYTIPSMDIETLGVNYSCGMTVAPPSCRVIADILREIGSLNQLVTHPETHVTTRDFLTFPFLPSQCSDGLKANDPTFLPRHLSVQNADSCEIINVHEVVGPAPCANLHNMRLLVEARDVPSLCARMIGNTGLIVRVGEDNTAIDSRNWDDE